MKDRIERYRYRYNRLNRAFDRLFSAIAYTVPTFQELVFSNKHPINNYHGFINPDIFYLPPYSSWFYIMAILPLFGYRLVYLGRYSYKKVGRNRYNLIKVPVYELTNTFIPVKYKVVEEGGQKRTFPVIVLEPYASENWVYEEENENVYPTPFFVIKVSGQGRRGLDKNKLLSLLKGYVDVNTILTEVDITENIEGAPMTMGHVETTEILETSVYTAHGMPVNNVFED